MEPGPVAQAYNQHLGRLRQEDHEFKACLGYRGGLLAYLSIMGVDSPGRLMAKTQGVVRGTSSQEGLPSQFLASTPIAVSFTHTWTADGLVSNMLAIRMHTSPIAHAGLC